MRAGMFHKRQGQALRIGVAGTMFLVARDEIEAPTQGFPIPEPVLSIS